MMDFLARRDHSEKELRQKLREREFPEEEIDKALAWAHERQWLKESDKVSTQMAESWHRKQKGIHYINHQLRTKGLPPVAEDAERELEKAQASLAVKKFKAAATETQLKLQKIRFLTSRGFSQQVIQQALKASK